MAKVKPKQLSEKTLHKFLGEFYSIITILETKGEVEYFLKELLSTSETVMLARRIQIAKMLLAEFSYNQIREELGSGFGTISSVQRWIDGGWGGYFKALEKVGKRAKQNKET